MTRFSNTFHVEVIGSLYNWRGKSETRVVATHFKEGNIKKLEHIEIFELVTLQITFSIRWLPYKLLNLNWIFFRSEIDSSLSFHHVVTLHFPNPQNSMTQLTAAIHTYHIKVYYSPCYTHRKNPISFVIFFFEHDRMGKLVFCHLPRKVAVRGYKRVDFSERISSTFTLKSFNWIWLRRQFTRRRLKLNLLPRI